MNLLGRRKKTRHKMQTQLELQDQPTTSKPPGLKTSCFDSLWMLDMTARVARSLQIKERGHH
jgi:hypothetical protein